MLPFTSLLLSTFLLTAPPLPTQDAAAVTAEVSPDRLIADVNKLVSFGTRHSLSPKQEGRGIHAARDWMVAELQKLATETNGRINVAVQTFTPPKSARIPIEGAEISNILVAIPGRGVEIPRTGDPDADRKELMTRLPSLKRVCIVAHYDSRNGEANDTEKDAPGANDNGSGTAAALEIIRVLAKRAPLDHSVVFVLTAGEEQGLLGAKFLVDVIKGHGEQIIGVLNMDIVGDPTGTPRDDGTVPVTRDKVRLFSEGIPKNPTAEQLAQIKANSAESDSTSRQLARYIAEVVQAQKLDVQPMLVFRQDRYLRGGDHIPYNDEGFPAVRFTQVNENYARQHQYTTATTGDTPNFVDKDYLAGVTRVVAASAFHLAAAPPAPEKVRIVTVDLGVKTTLRWTLPSPPAGEAAPGDIAGYEIIWRETTSPTWQHAQDVGRVGTVTVEISKDDHFFGVRSYDARGYRSPVVFAMAGRS